MRNNLMSTMDSETLTLIKMLEKTTSADQNELNAAKQYLDLVATNFETFVKMLSEALAQEGSSQVARTAAGLQLQNHLTSENDTLDAQYKQRWLALPEDVRSYVKNNIITAIGTENRPSSAVKCVAYVAAAELPVGQWNELIPYLVDSVVNANSTELKKEASLEAIGNICLEIDAAVLKEQSHPILTAITHGVRSTEPSKRVRLAAMQALVDCFRSDYQKEEHTFDFEGPETIPVANSIAEAISSSDREIKVAAFQCMDLLHFMWFSRVNNILSSNP